MQWHVTRCYHLLPRVQENVVLQARALVCASFRLHLSHQFLNQCMEVHVHEMWRTNQIAALKVLKLMARKTDKSKIGHALWVGGAYSVFSVSHTLNNQWHL